MKLGERLRDMGVIRPIDIERATRHAERTGLRFGSALIDLGIIDAETVADVLAKHHGVEAAKERDFEAATDATKLLTSRLARHYNVFPLFGDDKELTVAAVTPQDVSAIDELSFACKRKIKLRIASQWRISHALDKAYGKVEGRHTGPQAVIREGRDTLEDDERPDRAGGASAPQHPGRVSGAHATPAEETAPAAAGAATGANPRLNSEASTLESAAKEITYSQAPVRSNKILWGALGVAVLVGSGSLMLRQKNERVARQGVAVEGSFESTYLGLMIDIPSTGWRLFRRENHEEPLPGVTIRTSMFLRGNDRFAPELGLFLSSMDMERELPEEIEEKDFSALVSRLERANVKVSRKNFTSNEADCEITNEKDELLAECESTGTYHEADVHTTTWYWVETSNKIIAAQFFSEQDLGNFEAEIEMLRKSVVPEPGDEPAAPTADSTDDSATTNPDKAAEKDTPKDPEAAEPQ